MHSYIIREKSHNIGNCNVLESLPHTKLEDSKGSNQRTNYVMTKEKKTKMTNNVRQNTTQKMK